MSVIAVVTTAHKIYKIVKNFNTRMKPYGPYEQWSSKFPPNYRPYVKDALRGADIAFSGGLISEAIHFGLDALPVKTNNQKGQTRDNMEQFGTRRFKYSSYKSRKRCIPRYQRRRKPYRMRNRF